MESLRIQLYYAGMKFTPKKEPRLISQIITPFSFPHHSEIATSDRYYSVLNHIQSSLLSDVEIWQAILNGIFVLPDRVNLKKILLAIDILSGSSSSSSNDEDDKQNYLTEGSRLVFGANEYNNNYRVEKYTLLTVSFYLLSISDKFQLKMNAQSTYLFDQKD